MISYKNLPKSWLGIVLQLFSVVFFVAGHSLVKYLSQFVPLNQIVLFRFAFTPIILLPFFMLGKLRFDFSNPKLLFFRGIIGTIGMYLYFIGIKYGALGKINLLFNMSVVWAFFLMIFLFKVQANWKQFFAVITTLIGVGLILKPTNIMNFGFAEILTLVGSFCASLAFISIKKLRRNHNSWSIVFVFFSVAAMSFAVPNIFTYKPQPLSVIGLLCLVGVLGVSAHMSMTSAYKYISVTVGSSVSLSAIPLMYVIGLIFFGEVIDKWSVFGIVLFLVSVIFITFSEREWD